MQPDPTRPQVKKKPAKPEVAAAPAPVPAPAEGPTPPSVYGEPVGEMSCLVSPAAFLVSSEGGTHEITRLYFQKGKYTIAHSTSRLGPHGVVGAELTQERLIIRFDTGYLVSIPATRVQASYLTP